jgi:hypothetical protein
VLFSAYVCVFCVFALGKKQPTTMHTHSISRENTERAQSRPKHSHVIEIFVRGFLDVISFTFALTLRQLYAVCLPLTATLVKAFSAVGACMPVGGRSGISFQPTKRSSPLPVSF